MGEQGRLRGGKGRGRCLMALAGLLLLSVLTGCGDDEAEPDFGNLTEAQAAEVCAAVEDWYDVGVRERDTFSTADGAEELIEFYTAEGETLEALDLVVEDDYEFPSGREIGETVTALLAANADRLVAYRAGDLSLKTTNEIVGAVRSDFSRLRVYAEGTCFAWY